jgi:hypothetical protein
MSGLPGLAFQHQVTVEAWHGEGPDGPRYGAPVVVTGFLSAQTRMVRATDGTQVTSTSTVLCPLDTVAPAQSRVTLPDGRVTSVIAALRQDGGRLPVPSHLELQLV